MATKVLIGTPAMVGVTLVDQNGSPRDATGVVTCTVRASDATVLYADVPAMIGADTGQFTFQLTSVDTGQLDLLMVTWVESGGAVIDTGVEVIGGYMFSLAEARANPMLADPGKYSDDVLLAARRAVEEECEAITGRSPVPRFKRARVDGRGTHEIRLPNYDIRYVRELWADSSWYAVDGIVVEPYGRVALTNGYFPYGEATIEAAYEYGTDGPPERVKQAGLVRLQAFATLVKVGAPDRWDFTIVDGKLYASDAPGIRGSLTGIREVDSAYQAWGVRGGDSKAVPIG